MLPLMIATSPPERASPIPSCGPLQTRYTAEMRRQDARADTVGARTRLPGCLPRARSLGAISHRVRLETTRTTHAIALLLHFAAAFRSNLAYRPPTVEFGAMVKELLKEFYTSMKERFPSYRWCPAATNEGPWLPKRIVIFRDGVSDGEFRDVLDREVRQLLLVFEEVFEEMRGFHPEWHEYLASRGGYQPLLTVIVVQKNHGTRLFPAPRDPNNPGDPSVNVAAVRQQGPLCVCKAVTFASQGACLCSLCSQ